MNLEGSDDHDRALNVPFAGFCADNWLITVMTFKGEAGLGRGTD